MKGLSRMNTRMTVSCLSAMGLALSLAGCGGNGKVSAYSVGTAGAPLVLVKSVPLPNTFKNWLIGYDIGYVDDKTRTYYLGAAQYAGVITLDLDTLVTSSPTVNFVIPTGANAFAGNQTDAQDPYGFPGGPNGVLTVDSKELWVADANTYTGNLIQGVASPNSTYSNDNCNSSVKVIDLSTIMTDTPSVSTIYTNGCFKSDELAYDSTDHLVLVGNPDEQDIGINKAGVPTGPFISLISTTSKKVLAQIAFDGTNGTPNATGGIEQPVYSPATGKFYVAVPSDGFVLDSNGAPVIGSFGPETDPNGVIAVVDPTTTPYTVTKIPLTDCMPNGMALGPDNKEVFLACNSFSGPQVVSLVANGSVPAGTMLAQFAASVPAPTDAASLAAYNQQGSSCDEAWYNPTLNDYMAVCDFSYNNANFTVINAGTGLDSTTIKFQENVATNPNAMLSTGAAHSIASDPTTGAVLVPLPLGDPLCGPANGCIGVYAPQGSTLQLNAK